VVTAAWRLARRSAGSRTNRRISSSAWIRGRAVPLSVWDMRKVWCRGPRRRRQPPPRHRTAAAAAARPPPLHDGPRLLPRRRPQRPPPMAPDAAGAGHADGPFGVARVLPPAGNASWPIVPLGVVKPTTDGRSYRQRCHAHRRTDQRSERTGCAPTDCRKAFRSGSGVTQPPPPHCISTAVARQQYSPGRPAPCRRPECPAENVSFSRSAANRALWQRFERTVGNPAATLGNPSFSHGDHCTLRRRVFRLWSGW